MMKVSIVISLALFSCLSLYAEDLLDLKSFEKKKGWLTVERGEVNPTKLTDFILKKGTGKILSNGESKNRTGYLTTSKQWGDHEINAEFMISKDSNSGFYVLGRYEIQVFDSHGKSEVTNRDMGGVYQRWDMSRKRKGLEPGYDGVAPLVNAARPHGEWQTINIKFRAPRFDEEGNKVSHAHFVEVTLNGKVVQKSINAKGPTRVSPLRGEESTGPLAIQGNHGPILFRKLDITSRDYSDIKLPALSKAESQVKAAPSKLSKKPQEDLVKLGKKAFTNRGCIECHASFLDNKTIKTGPSLYGIFQKTAIKHEVFDSESQKDIKKLADKSYFLSSLTNPIQHLSIQTQESERGKPYMPLMPPYSEEMIPAKEAEAIYRYLLTLNTADNAGPEVVLVDAEEVKESDETHPHILIVGEDTMVTRAFINNGTSAKSIHVGQPNGQSFTFDPRKLAIESVWSKGFLDMRKEVDGRGKRASAIAPSAKRWAQKYTSILRPQSLDGSAYDSPLTHSVTPDTMERTTSFMDQLAARNGKFLGYEMTENNPTIHYTIDGNQIDLNFSIEADGTMNATLSGKLKQPLILTFPADSFKDVSISGGELDKGEGTWEISSLKTPLKWSAVPASAITTETVTKESRIQNSPFAWSDESSQIEIVPGYSVMRAEGPQYTDGVIPLFEPTAIDFDQDGTPVIGSRAAGIWKVKDDQWQPFALGLHEVLGLTVKANGDLIVCQKPEVTLVKDGDKDSVADVFQTLSADFRYSGNYHAYNHGPAVDSKGNIHFTLNLQHERENTHKAGGRYMGSQGGFRGWNCQISDKGDFSPYAMGFRSAAGLTFSPDDQLYASENQGEFVGTSRISRVEKGKFYGHPSGLIDLENMSVSALNNGKQAEYIEKRESATILLPHKFVANSPGHPVWDTTKGGFGPYKGQIFIGDQGLSNIHRIHLETVDGVEQGSIMPFATSLPSGPMRLAFSPEGEMWVGQTGRGWASRGNEPSALQKFKWDGRLEQGIHHVSAQKGGFMVYFNLPIDEADHASYNTTAIDSWFYKDSKNYGSPELGKREETYTEPVWEKDGKSVFYPINNFGNDPARERDPNVSSRVFRINLEQTAFGTGSSAFLSTAYYTLNTVPKN